MDDHTYSGFWERPKKSCCRRRGTQLLLLALLTAAMWAGLLALLLLWHWDSVQNLKQLEVAAIRNVSHVSKDLQRYQSDQMAQKSQAARMSQNMQELQEEQKQMKSQAAQMSQNMQELQEEQKQRKSQDSRLSRNLDRLQEDLTNVKSQSLNEHQEASDSLERLQEEVAKLWLEVHMSKGTACNHCPENWLSFRHKCYYFGKGSKQWIQARFACSDLDGRLVSIHSQEEQDFLTPHLKERSSWIGLRDLDVEGEFVWMDDSPLDYSNWSPGEPNNAGQGEHCVLMWKSGQWNDAFCRSFLDAWVCEQLATCGPPAPVASSGNGIPDPTDGP